MLTFLAVTMVGAAPQGGSQRSISLDESRPYVEIVFERSGERVPVFDGEGKQGLWLKLRNNCVLPIEVRVLPGNRGNPGFLVPHEVIEELAGVRPLSGHRPLLTKPSGYGSPDVGNSRAIAPEKDLLFSVPLNHVTREWFLRVEIELVMPVPARGNQPRTFVEFYWSQLPEDVRRESDQALYGRISK